MKLTVLMPTCDWPRGSGMMNPNTRDAIRSVLDQPIDDLELWIRADGDQPQIRCYVEGLHSKKIQFSEGPSTRSSGNHQRRFLMEQLLASSRVDGFFAFHDDDDAYLPGALAEMAKLAAEHKCPVLARHVRALLSHVMTPEAIEHSAGWTWPFKIPVSFAASVFPIVEGMPLWPTEGGYYADLPYANDFVKWFEGKGYQIMLLDKTVTRIRPQDREGSLVAEPH